MEACDADGEETAKSILSSVACHNYTVGFLDGWYYDTSETVDEYSVCIPDEVTIKQVSNIVVKHIKNNPETELEAAAELIPEALFNAFPCLSEDNQE